MAIVQNGAAVALAAVTGGVSTTGALTCAVGGTALTSTALMFIAISITSATATNRTVTSVTDSNGNTWQKYWSSSANSGWNIPNTSPNPGNLQTACDAEIWYTQNATIGTTFNITVNASGACDAIACVTTPKFSGYDSSNPIDPSHISGGVGSPVVQFIHSGNAARTLTVSTTNTHILGIAAAMGMGGSVGAGNDTFNGNLRNDSARRQSNGTQEFAISQIENDVARTGPYSSVTFSDSTAADNSWYVGFCITSDATVVGPTGTWASTEAKDTFAGVGIVLTFSPRGDWLSTEAADTFAAVGYPRLNGSWVSTEAADKFLAFGKLPLSGTFVVTEAKDKFSATGLGRGVDGKLAATEAKDTFHATGFVPIKGTWNSTEAADRFMALGVGAQVRRRRVRFVT